VLKSLGKKLLGLLILCKLALVYASWLWFMQVGFGFMQVGLTKNPYRKNDRGLRL